MKTSAKFTTRQKALLSLIATNPAVITASRFATTLRSVRLLFAKARAAGIDFSYFASRGKIVLWAPARDTALNTRHLGTYDALLLSGLSYETAS